MAETSLNYEVIIYYSKEDNVFLDEAAELPGRMADGITQKRGFGPCSGSDAIVVGDGPLLG